MPTHQVMRRYFFLVFFLFMVVAWNIKIVLRQDFILKPKFTRVIRRWFKTQRVAWSLVCYVPYRIPLKDSFIFFVHLVVELRLKDIVSIVDWTKVCLQRLIGRRVTFLNHHDWSIWSSSFRFRCSSPMRSMWKPIFLLLNHAVFKLHVICWFFFERYLWLNSAFSFDYLWKERLMLFYSLRS